jgi:hypothetical protein
MELSITLEPAPAPPFLVRSVRYVVGCDLGQSSDPTAICILEHQKGVFDPNNDFERHTGLGRKPQTAGERIHCRHLERLPLGMSYPTVVEHLKALMLRPPLTGDRQIKPAELVVDDSGVGRPVSDLLVDAGLKPIRVTITAGNEVSPVGPNRFHVAKTILISTVDAVLHTGVLRFAASLGDAEAMREELKDFRRKLTDAGRATYAARTGAHDDLVLAVAIACWWISRPPPPQAAFGSYGMTYPESEYSGRFST